MVPKPCPGVGDGVVAWCCLVWRKGILGSCSSYFMEGKTECTRFQSPEE